MIDPTVFGQEAHQLVSLFLTPSNVILSQQTFYIIISLTFSSSVVKRALPAVVCARIPPHLRYSCSKMVSLNQNERCNFLHALQQYYRS